MPTWGNTDASNAKPKFAAERQTREVIQVALYANANTTANGTNTITVLYNDGGQNNVANIGIVSGQYVYVAGQGTSTSGLSGGGYPGFFAGNTTVLSTSGNTITLSANITSNLAVGTIVEFDKSISWRQNGVANTYNQDTILVTASRAANNTTTSPSPALANTGNFNAGWVHIQKKVNNDGTVRYLKETLVALANPVASNTNSGNTSFGQFVSGL